jgi:hypothetical protein
MSSGVHWNSFWTKKTEHYGSFQRSEYGTRMNFKNKSNFAIPLVILTRHQMLQEFFWKNSNKTFFHFRNYISKNTRNSKQLLDNLYLINEIGVDTTIRGFDMIRSDSDADLVKKVCPSLL